MQDCDAVPKVDEQPALPEYVPSKKNIVWRFKGAQTHDIHLDIKKWITERQKESDLEIGRASAGQAGLVDNPAREGNKAEFADESWANACAAGPGVDLRQGAGVGFPSQSSNSDFNGGAVLKEAIDRLVKTNLGPSGFFIIAHRGL